MIKGASISTCKKYRWALWRTWDLSKDKVCFIGLNPSKADDTVDDNTITKLIEFSKRWGFGGFRIVNLFALRSTDPKALLVADDPVGMYNDFWIECAVERCSKTVFCWGAFKKLNNRDQEIINKYPDAYCFGKTKAGHPKNPLMLPYSTTLINF